MFPNRHLTTRSLLLLTALLTITVPATASPLSNTPASSVPEGFDQFGVFMGTGDFDPATPHPDPRITGCFFLFCDGQYFQAVVMGRNPTEIAEEEEAAATFFMTRFGLDIGELLGTGRISLQSFFLDPRAEYRMYHLAGHRVPSEGWVVRDGGLLLLVLDPGGIDLGGEQAGGHAPAGSMLVFGNYNVQTTRPNGKPAGEIVIRYKSVKPVTPLADGSTHFACEVGNDKLGSGLAQGLMANVSRPDGTLKLNIRNVLTFPGLGY